jgi:hypothetical protein
MTDYNSALPIRSQADGASERVHVKVVDPTNPDSQQAIVDTDNNFHVEIHGNNPSGGDETIRTSEVGHISIDGIRDGTNNTDPSNIGIISHERNATPDDTHQTVRLTGSKPSADSLDPDTIRALDINAFLMAYDATADTWSRVSITNNSLDVNADLDGVYDDPDNLDPDNVGLIAHTRNATPDDTHQVKRLTAITNDTVHALDVSLHDHAGAPYTESNPFPVAISDAAGADVHNYNTYGALAKDGVNNHDYPVTSGKTLRLKQIQVSGSGKVKAELQIETGVGTGLYTSRAVWFNSTAFPVISETFAQPLEIAAGVKVRLARTNKDNQAQDVYSFINGSES